GAAPFEKGMLVPWCDQDPPPQHGIIVLRLFDRDPAYTVESVCEGAGKVLGHMLDDNRTGCIFREGFQKYLQGLRPTGRCAYRHHSLRGLHHSLACRLRYNRIRSKLGLYVEGLRDGLFHMCPCCCLYRIADDDPGFFEELFYPDPGLLDDIHRAV